jgi:transitional endoplasmic reticulum ATPase
LPTGNGLALVDDLELFQEVLDAARREKAKSTNPDQDRIMRTLEELGGLSVQEDALLFIGDKFILPKQFDGNVPAAIKFLQDWIKQQEQQFDYYRDFSYRPYDGAAAFQSALKKIFGNTGVGKSRWTFFGEIRPKMITVDAGVGTTMQVPWGEVTYSPLEATFQLGSTRDNEYGSIFRLSVTAPKKYAKHVQAVFDVIEAELRENSIYKGKAIDGADTPRFVDTTKVDPAKVVYSEDTLLQLDANLWSVLKYTAQLRALGQSINRKVLIEGPYGTGKSLAGVLTAQHAISHGFTFIMCRAGDDLAQALNTAKLYAPAVVWFEDIDVVAADGTAKDISKLLDSLDSIGTKGLDVVSAFTTNHVEKIQKGVMRPGRIDAVIHIGKLDASGVRRLVESVIPGNTLEDVDWDQVAAAYDEFLPAFVSEAATRAVRYSLARHGGQAGTLVTEDLVAAGVSLRPQLDLMDGAREGSGLPTADSVLKGLVHDQVAQVLNTTTVVDGDGDQVYDWELRTDPERRIRNAD